MGGGGGGGQGWCSGKSTRLPPMWSGLYIWWHLGERGWCSGESTRLQPTWPGSDSRSRRHMWVEFVEISRLKYRVFMIMEPGACFKLALLS